MNTRTVERVDGGEGVGGFPFDMEVEFVDFEDTFGNGEDRKRNKVTSDFSTFSSPLSRSPKHSSIMAYTTPMNSAQAEDALSSSLDNSRD